MKIPSKIIKGDSVEWTDFPGRDNLGNVVSPPDWTLTYSIRGQTVLNLTAVADGVNWKTTLSAVQSAALGVGVYFWQSHATRGSDRVTIGQGSFEVLPNLATEAANFDGRSQARKDLDAVQAAIRSMIAGGAVQEYTIGTRSIKKMTLSDLMKLESDLKFECKKEEQAELIRNGLGNPHKLFVRFK